MTFTAERARRWLAVSTTALALVAGLAGAAGQAATGQSPAVAGWLAKADAALMRGDGIAAEMRLRDALAAGASRADVAAGMGEAYVQQGERVRAREWLEEGQFAAGQEARGWRMRGLLERIEGNLAGAGAAYDKALAFAPRDPLLWVAIGRLRFIGGEQAQAIEAADRAIALDPGHVRALEFKGQLERERQGQRAALAWFERALVHAPDDKALLGEYAATLGEAGRMRDMLMVTRRMIELDADDPKPWFLQAVLAARAGQWAVARGLLDRTGGRLRDVPSAMLLDGSLNLAVGNAAQAVEQFDRLVRLQPANERAALLLARALFESGQYRALVDRFADKAARPVAPVYLLTLLARSCEMLDQRKQAAMWIDRAAVAGVSGASAIHQDEPLGVLALRWQDAPRSAATTVPYLRKLLESRDLVRAQAVAESVRQAAPGASEAWTLAGDVQLARGAYGPAAARYGTAAQIRLNDGLLTHWVEALVRSGRGGDAGAVVGRQMALNPQARGVLRLGAAMAGMSGDWQRARTVLEYLRVSGADRDVALLCDLAYADLKLGDGEGALAAARRAYALQRSSRMATLALAGVLESRNDPRAAMLRAKAEKLKSEG